MTVIERKWFLNASWNRNLAMVSWCPMILFSLGVSEFWPVTCDTYSLQEMEHLTLLMGQRTNAPNVSFETLHGGQFTLSTHLILLNYPFNPGSSEPTIRPLCLLYIILCTLIQYIFSVLSSIHFLRCSADKENLFNNQKLKLVIISFIILTFICDLLVTL